MRWFELFIKWSPVVAPWFNTICFVVIIRINRLKDKIFTDMARTNEDFVCRVAEDVLVLQAEVARLKALAGIAGYDDDVSSGGTPSTT
jgi:hypothetical protein